MGQCRGIFIAGNNLNTNWRASLMIVSIRTPSDNLMATTGEPFRLPSPAPPRSSTALEIYPEKERVLPEIHADDFVSIFKGNSYSLFGEAIQLVLKVNSLE